MRSVDVLIVGGDAGALATAALLGRRGLRGLILVPPETSLPSPHRREDWIWDDRHAAVLGRVHEELALQDAFRRKAIAVRPGLRFVSRQRRVELEPEDAPSDVLARLLRLEAKEVLRQVRALDGPARKVGEFLEEAPLLPPAGFFERRRLQTLLDAHPELTTLATESLEPTLFEHLQALLPFLTHQVANGIPPSIGRLARPAHLLFQGPRLPDGGRPLRALLEDRAIRSGFETKRARLIRLEPERRRFVVDLEGGRDTYLVDVVVDATGGLEAVMALPQAMQSKRFSPLIERHTPAGYLAEVSWSVDAEVVPEPLGHVALIEDDGEVLWLTLEHENDRLHLSLEMPVPVSATQDLDGLRGRARACLERLIPFFSDGRPRPGTIRFEPRLSAQEDDQTGMGGLPVRTPLKNLWLAGPGVLPGCPRLEAAYHAAAAAADGVSKHLGASA